MADKQRTRVVNELKQNYVMLIRNHGAITCGKTIHEAMFLYLPSRTSL